MLGINVREVPEVVQGYITRHRLTFPHLLDVEARVAAMLAVPGTPTTWLTDRAGQVLGGGSGYRHWASPAVYRLVEYLLNGTESKPE